MVDLNWAKKCADIRLGLMIDLYRRLDEFPRWVMAARMGCEDWWVDNRRLSLIPALTGLRSFWMQGGEALSAIGALDYSKEERKRLAKSQVIHLMKLIPGLTSGRALPAGPGMVISSMNPPPRPRHPYHRHHLPR